MKEEHLIAIQEHCGAKVNEMIEEMPDVITDKFKNTEKRELKKNLFATFMTFLTYLFKHEFIMLKRKDSYNDGKE